MTAMINQREDFAVIIGAIVERIIVFPWQLSNILSAVAQKYSIGFTDYFTDSTFQAAGSDVGAML